MDEIKRRVTKLEDCQDRTDLRYIEIAKSLAEIKIMLEDVVELKTKIDKYDKRLDKIEKFNSKTVGISIGVSIMIQLVAWFLIFILK